MNANCDQSKSDQSITPNYQPNFDLNNFENRKKYIHRDIAEATDIILTLARIHNLSNTMIATLQAILAKSGNRTEFYCDHQTLYPLMRTDAQAGHIKPESEDHFVFTHLKKLEDHQEKIGVDYYERTAPKAKGNGCCHYDISPLLQIIFFVIETTRQDPEYKNHPGKTLTHHAEVVAMELKKNAYQIKERKQRVKFSLKDRMENSRKIFTTQLNKFADAINPDNQHDKDTGINEMLNNIGEIINEYSTILTKLNGEEIKLKLIIDQPEPEPPAPTPKNKKYKIVRVISKEVTQFKSTTSDYFPTPRPELQPAPLRNLLLPDKIVGTGVENKDFTRFTISIFKNYEDKVPKRCTYTWHDFTEKLKQPELRDQKEGHLFSPAIFSGNRKKENVQSLSMLVFDVDRDTDFMDAANIILSENCKFAMYTSYNHTAEIHKFRIVIPLARSVTSKEHQALWFYFEHKFFEYGCKVDRACRDESRMFLLPAIQSKDSKFWFASYSQFKLLNPNNYDLNIEQSLFDTQDYYSNEKEVAQLSDLASTAGQTNEILFYGNGQAMGKWPDYQLCLNRPSNTSGRSSADYVFSIRAVAAQFTDNQILEKLMVISEKAQEIGEKRTLTTIQNARKYFLTKNNQGKVYEANN